jgi:hypothetical protein
MRKKRRTQDKTAKMQPIYQEIVTNYGIDSSASMFDQVHCMVEKAEELQDKICRLADEIKIDQYEVIKNIVPLTKGDWTDIVKITAARETLKDKTRQKYIDKTITTAKSSMCKNIHLLENLDANEISDMKILSENSFDVDFSETQDSEYNTLLESAVQNRIRINNCLYSEYNKLAQAAYYITNGEVTRPRFKKMVDFLHYQGEDGKPGRLTKTIFNFLEADYFQTRYGFGSLFQECKEEAQYLLKDSLEKKENTEEDLY